MLKVRVVQEQQPRRGRVLAPSAQDSAITAECWCIVNDIGSIDTVTFTVTIKADLYASWYDERLAKYEDADSINWDECWKPRFDCANRTHDVETGLRCDVLNEKASQFMCWVHINGTVFNPMDLRKFPFDHDDICLVMDSTNVMQAPDITELNLIPVQECNDVAMHVLQFGNAYDPEHDMLEFLAVGLETERCIYKVGKVEFAQMNYRIKVLRRPRMIV